MTNFRRKALRRIGLILMPLVLFGAEYGLPQANAAEPAAVSTLPHAHDLSDRRARQECPPR